MVITNVFGRIGLVFVIMGLFTVAMAITLDPSGDQSISDISGASRTFSLTSISDNATITWYLNETSVQTNESNISSGITTASYTNNSASAGFWNVSALVVNKSNPSDIAMTRWWWTVTSPVVSTEPAFSSVNAINVKDTTADIIYTLDQSNTRTIVHYGPHVTLGSESSWDNGSSITKTIQLTELTAGLPYYYSVFAYNATNESYFTNSSPIQSFTTVAPTIPVISGENNGSLNSSSITINFTVDQADANTSVLYSSTCPLAAGTESWNNNSGTSRTIKLNGLTQATPYCYRINAYNSTNLSFAYNTIDYPFTTTYPSPSISSYEPTENTIDILVGQSKTFRVTPDQDVTVAWTIDGSLKETDIVNLSQEANYTFSTSSQGNFTLRANASNANGSALQEWAINVHPKTYATGNRIWDASKDMSTTYTWSPMSFYAFYYDVDDDVGNESLKIILNSKYDRNVGSNNLIYKTQPEEVTFKYNKWGKYNVIGFMAEKYFAGYTSNTNISDVDPISTLGRQQLHKVVFDDDDTHTVSTSKTYPIGEGYSINIKDVGAGREAMIAILKDGGEVYTDFKEKGETLVFTKKVGVINDLPIIILHIGNVFMGTTSNMVQIDGIFQISESYTAVNSRNTYGMMKIQTVSDSEIEMRNGNSFTLSSGTTIDIMGDMKFIVANNDSVLRFAPMVKKTGEYEVRGTISNNETDNLWTPLSFEGFYYNIDEDVGTESLTLNRSGRNVGIDNIVYTTTATSVSHEYSALGRYNVIGFMAEKYFAGYEAGQISTKGISTINRNQLHKVLIDDDTQRIIYAGSTLTLNDGYVIKIKDVNMGAGSAEVWLSVLKDGNEVGDGIMEKGDVFKFEKDVGTVKELPIIALRIDNIFRGKEATAAFVRGTFQISESYKTVKAGDTFDKMKVEAVTTNSITMKNPSAISLDTGSSDTLMGKVRLKVADSSDIRFYPYIMVNGSALAENQLSIKAPSSMMARDVISIQVISGEGTPQDNAEVSFDGEIIGTTNTTGKLDYMLTKAGKHNFTATKLGYETATKVVQIDEYVDNRLNFELPEFIDQYIPISIKVKVSGTGNATPGANVSFDGTSIGTTDNNGILLFTFTSSGTHNLAASKKGYITVQREINVRMPFTEFKANDINFSPVIVAKGQNVYVWANITNTGTKEGTLPVALIINSTVVENKNVTLAPGKQGQVNFSHKVELVPGNYSVEILGQKATMPVKEEPLNLLLIGGIITIIGALGIFIMTSNDILSIEALKSRLGMGPFTNREIINREAMDRALKNLMSKFQK